MHAFASSVLTFLLSALGILSVSTDFTNQWELISNWHKVDGYYELEAKSNRALDQCRIHPDYYLIFPQVVHSYNAIYLDGLPIAHFGDATFKTAYPFYAQPHIECSKLAGGKELVWKVSSYTKFFARIGEAPYVQKQIALTDFFDLTLNSLATGILIIMGLFSYIIYKGRIPNAKTYSVLLGSLLMAGYFMNCVNADFGITVSMLTSHKLADSSLWVGSLFFLNAFRMDAYLNNNLFKATVFSVVLGLSFILFGHSGDSVQLGTTLPMSPFAICCFNIIYNVLLTAKKNGFSRDLAFIAISPLFFVIAGLFDIVRIFGLTNNFMVMPIGSVGCMSSLSLAVSKAIELIYEERAVLLESMDKKVKEKTSELQQTLNQLTTTQAELVHSARLASLGTLSAGIAHEINNAINFVNGAVAPLEKRIKLLVPDTDRTMIDKLLNSIKEGTHLTIEIVKSLRNFTGLNQAEFRVVIMKEAVDSVLTILKSKLRDVEVQVNLSDEFKLMGNVVGINQIFMNLITNALDAVPKKDAKIEISGRLEDEMLIITVKDNGCGIPENIKNRVFDAFFTTKEVGQGTGLGLHIVHKEVERHKGTLKLTSVVGEGTAFEMSFPKSSAENQARSAA